MATGFSGFPKQGFAFLKELAKNNNRDWFQPRKDTFEDTVKAPMEALVEAMNAQLVKFAPSYVTDPNKAIYRIYRDTRFSKDKTPYKTHIAASFFRSAAEKHTHPGYYFSVSPERIEVAGGLYLPGPDQLRAVREHLLEHHTELRKLLANPTLKKLMGGLSGDPLTRPPKGFPAAHPALDLIRYKGWILYDTRMDPQMAATGRLLPELVKRFQAMAPLIDFLNRPLNVKKQRDPLTVGL
ncbi:MAG: DUF2461 domain-containing protein [Bryobacteraceae bacterium]|nr:DUF2461 domain-containing protein [Bryobacteraceae bacterium]